MAGGEARWSPRACASCRAEARVVLGELAVAFGGFGQTLSQGRGRRRAGWRGLGVMVPAGWRCGGVRSRCVCQTGNTAMSERLRRRERRLRGNRGAGGRVRESPGWPWRGSVPGVGERSGKDEAAHTFDVASIQIWPRPRHAIRHGLDQASYRAAPRSPDRRAHPDRPATSTTRPP